MILDESAVKRFGQFALGDFREFFGQRLKIIGRTREARSFTTNPIAFLDYRVAQSLDRHELHNRTTYILVKLDPEADAEAVKAEIRRRLPLQRRLDPRRMGEPVAVVLDRQHGAGAEHDDDRVPRLPGRRGGRRPDALHVDDGTHQGIRDGQGDRRERPRHLPRSSPSRRRSRRWSGSLSGDLLAVRPSAVDGRDRPEADHDAGLARRRVFAGTLRCSASGRPVLSFRQVARARPGPGLPGLANDEVLGATRGFLFSMLEAADRCLCSKLTT